ncbi:hypothetical protein IPG41_01570 [Candidatus Peregrinibacteria bacterium]|nr:MAG: hypothetical protein IPG41_01570 [Candidatus Peregrinibacteria bacterium]
MPKKLLFAFFSLSLLVTACQPQVDEEPLEVSNTDLQGVVSLSSEAAMELPLDAAFSSKNGTFSYSMKYDGGLMTLMETADASVPHFEILGGSSLEVMSDWVAAVAEDAEKAGAPVRVGSYDVYQFMDAEGTCALSVTLVPFSEEVLRFVLKTCPEADAEAGREALDQILKNLNIQTL